MQSQNPSLPKTLTPSFSPFLSNPLPKIQTLTPIHLRFPRNSKPISVNAKRRSDVRPFAGRSKKTGPVTGPDEMMRESIRKRNRRVKKYMEGFFYRLKNPNKNYPDNFTEDELQMIGLGYDRYVRFMEKDDPNLKHPFDWYKYGEFGPYSWRGVVLGEPIRGRFSNENVTLIGTVRDHEEWEKIQQHEMAQDFGVKLGSMDRGDVGFKYFWVFVRHPRWRVAEKPWEQWTLVSEVAVEAREQRLDKWSLMGRFGNNTRAQITQCAAWMRPDIIYVQRPVYQVRFEPQEKFFDMLVPLLDPETEGNYMCELEDDNGRVELCTYFGGLCKIVRANPKAFVDDVVKAYEKLSDEKKSKCLMFLLGNHPVELLHPYTQEWKAKLEEEELGCDAPDDEDIRGRDDGETEYDDWIEVEDDADGQDDIVMDMEVGVDDAASDGDDGEGEDGEDEGINPEEDEKYWDEKFKKAISNEADVGDEAITPELDSKNWDEEFKKAMSNNEAMENLVRRSAEMNAKRYAKQIREAEEMERRKTQGDGDEMAMRRTRAKVSPEEWKQLGFGRRMKRIRKSKTPPGLFLRAAVRPFTYTNLIKEIVLTRHAILEGEIKR